VQQCYLITDEMIFTLSVPSNPQYDQVYMNLLQQRSQQNPFEHDHQRSLIRWWRQSAS